MRGKICILVLLLTLVTTASAEGALVFGSGTEGLLFAADGSTPMDHLFGSSLAISPGEILEETLCIRPRSEIRLGLQCLDVSQELSGLQLTVQGETLLYDGPLTGLVNLGRFSSETPVTLTLRLTVPENLSPQGRRDWLKLRWNFTVLDNQSPRTGDKITTPAAIFTGALTGLALALPQRHRFRKKA